jgi:uracil permease
VSRSPARGYLPQDVPPLGALISLGFQHVVTMFPATVVVALATKFDVGVTLFASGLATIIALLGSRRRIPLYYGASFSYIAAIVGVVGAQWGGVRVAQVGIVATAFVSIIAGLLIQWVGKKAIDKVLPPIITGSMAIVIGISLSKVALDDAKGNWTIAIVTLVATILFSVYLQGKGLLGMLPVLLGAVAGYLTALAMGQISFASVAQAPWLRWPAFTLPDFGNPNALKAVFAIAPIAIATIPESTAHLYQISLYIDRVAEDMGRPALKISRLIGLNLVLDGTGDFINGMLGGCAGTNYGENNSLMAITRNYSVPVLMCAGAIAIAMSFIGKLSAVVMTMPAAVKGGLCIYLFGVIGLQGVALIQSEKVDLFDPRQLAIGAVISVVGIGGSFFAGGNIPVGTLQLPAIATAALVGILLNVIFIIFPPKKTVAAEEPAAAGGE